MKIKNFSGMIFAILICEAVVLPGSLFTLPAIPTWYAHLIKPAFNPPNWLFAPVWTILFALMGVSAYLIWSGGLDKKKVKTAIIFFIVQLILNSLWSIIFFGLHSPLFAFLEIVVLWIFILITILRFYKISKIAGLILLPYIFWVSFAAILNLSVYLLNR